MDLDTRAGVDLDGRALTQVWHDGKSFQSFFTHYGSPAARTSFYFQSDDGVTWSRWKRIAAIEEDHYQISALTQDRAACAFNYHPKGKGLNFRTNLYYLETRDGGEHWCTANGEPVQTPVTTVESEALVWDARAEGLLVYLKDLSFDEGGRPRIVTVSSRGHASGPQNGPRTWNLHRFDGQEWIRTEITTSDNNYDMGSLDDGDGELRLIAPTIPGPQPYNPGGEMASWISDDEGATWNLERALTHGSLRNHTYARRPVGADPGFVSFWADGNAREPSESRLYFADRAGHVYRLPVHMDGEFATPEVVVPD